MLYTLLELGLPVEKQGPTHPRGTGVRVPARTSRRRRKVFTGHDDGLITINIAEADDPFREKMRIQMGETYRTLLGHFRHEIGHYYWDRLIEDTPIARRLPRALRRRARRLREAARSATTRPGPPPDWRDRFVSAYASMHPWEDWAETWAHYLHMVDTLETARAYGLSLRPRPSRRADRQARRRPTLDPTRSTTSSAAGSR